MLLLLLCVRRCTHTCRPATRQAAQGTAAHKRELHNCCLCACCQVLAVLVPCVVQLLLLLVGLRREVAGLGCLRLLQQASMAAYT